MEICILMEPAHLIPEHTESQQSQRDGVKRIKNNEVIGKFLDSGRRSIHTAVDPFPCLLA